MPVLSRYVETLSLLGDENRIRLCALLRDRELCVTDLVRVTGISQSRVSTHLGRLREAGFVRDRRQGSQAFYALDLQGLPAGARALLDEAAESADPTLRADQERLEALDAERRGDGLGDDLERDYSPGRSWRSLALGLTALLELGDVLDVGSGDGAAAATLAPACRRLTCVDVNPRKIEVAKERLAKFDHVTALVADAHALPFEADRFDAVLLFHTLTYTDDPAKALAECARVLRPGGRLVLLCLDAHERREVTARFGERHAGFSPRALGSLLRRAGFAVDTAGVACRESKRPHLQVVLAAARKPGIVPSPSPPKATRN